MPQLTLTINGRAYRVACDTGQEQHVGRLARYIDQKVGEIVSGSGPAADSLLLVMAGLLIADELSEALNELKTLKEEKAAVASNAARQPTPDPAITDALTELTKRVEAVAERAETT